MRVVEYDSKYLYSTSIMLDKYFNEVTSNRPTYLTGNMDVCSEAIDKILYTHRLYLLLSNTDELIGFMTCYLNDEYGMVDRYLVCEYQYIEPEYRGGRAVALLTKTLAELCVKLQPPIVNTTILTSRSTHNMDKLGAEPIAMLSELSLNKATAIYNKYNRRNNR
jgi:hypothetical protein